MLHRNISVTTVTANVTTVTIPVLHHAPSSQIIFNKQLTTVEHLSYSAVIPTDTESIMKYSDLKMIKNLCDELVSAPDWREVVEGMQAETDFKVDNVRFIRADEIDQIMCDELKSDLYMLGYFDADFLSGILNIDSDAIESIQNAGACEALGKIIIGMDKLEEVQQGYVSADGYGHHFNRYDDNEEMIRVDGNEWYVFDNR